MSKTGADGDDGDIWRLFKVREGKASKAEMGGGAVNESSTLAPTKVYTIIMFVVQMSQFVYAK